MLLLVVIKQGTEMRWAIAVFVMTVSVGFLAVKILTDLDDGVPSKAPSLATTSEGDRPPRIVRIPRNDSGYFEVDARVDGRTIAFVVDTGAPVVALTRSDAEKLGMHPADSEYTVNARTAKGQVRAALTNLSSIDVGGIVVNDIRALIISDDILDRSLLGMSFLTKFKKFEYRRGNLFLER